MLHLLVLYVPKLRINLFKCRIVYNWFYRLYQVCSNAALIGYIMVLVDFALSVGMVEVHSLSTMGILLVFYGIYFGVIGRDLAEFCSDRMAQTMGVRVT